jgi:protein gp37
MKRKIEMGEKTAIEWADDTFNPWWGCSKVSEGCAHCYAENLARRFGVDWGPTATRRLASDAYWNQPRLWNKQAEQAGVPRRVFCGSMCDVFEEGATQHLCRQTLFQLIRETPHLIWMLLTKRPENIIEMIPRDFYKDQINTPFNPLPNPPPGLGERTESTARCAHTRKISNVWLGVTAENQARWNERMPILADIPGFTKFVSCEPLLGPIQFNNPYDEPNILVGDIDWIIVGGESGPKARPMHPEWARSIRDQCQRHKILFFFKQWGEFCPKGSITLTDRWGTLDIEGHWFSKTTPWNGVKNDPPNYEVVMEQIGKKSAGRVLDRREWDEVPSPPAPSPRMARGMNIKW